LAFENIPIGHRLKYLTLQGQIWLGSLSRAVKSFPNLLSLNIYQDSKLSRAYPHSPLLALTLQTEETQDDETEDDFMEEDFNSLRAALGNTRSELFELLGGEDCKQFESLHQMILHVQAGTAKAAQFSAILNRVRIQFHALKVFLQT